MYGKKELKNGWHCHVGEWMLAGPLRRAGTRIGAVSVTREKAGELLGQCRAIAEASGLTGIEFMRTPSPGMIRTPDGSTAEFLSADKNSGHASGFDVVVVTNSD